MPSEPRAEIAVVLTAAPTPADLAAVARGLDRFNVAATGVDDQRPLAVLVRDSDRGATVGGLTGRTTLGLWFVDFLWLPDRHRGSGLGTAILHEAETEARRRGCTAGVLYTINFQAPDFYARQGWTEFGRIPCAPPGTSRIFMTKSLA